MNRLQSEVKYFENFPYDETIVRTFLKARQKLGWHKDVDIDNTPLIEMLSSPDARGDKIISLTKGPGTHYSSIHTNRGVLMTHEVKEGEVYITLNTMRVMAGDCRTYVMVDGDIIKSYLLAMS
jgi:hypothetical protein